MTNVFLLCEKYSQEGKDLVNDEASHYALRRMAGIGLFLSQQKARGEKPEYNNPNEFLELLEVSRTLKGVYPELFEKYGVKENLQTIARLQLEKQSGLENRIQSAMESVFGEPTTEKNMVQDKQVKERE